MTPTPLNAADVAKLLRRGEALFRVLPGERETWVFLVSVDGALRGSAVKLPARQLTATVARSGADASAIVGTMPTFDLTLAHQLYEQLLGPVEAGLVGVNHLIVAPACWATAPVLPPALLVRRLPAEPATIAAPAGWCATWRFTCCPPWSRWNSSARSPVHRGDAAVYRLWRSCCLPQERATQRQAAGLRRSP